MRLPRALGSALLAVVVAGTAPVAAAPLGGQQAQTFSYDAVGLQKAAVDSAAMGPDLLAAGPAGMAAFYDPTKGRVVVLQDLRIQTAFPAGLVHDLAFSRDGLVLLLNNADRTLRLVSPNGQRTAVTRLPDRVPPDCTLRVDGDSVEAVDALGGRHSVARLDGHQFAPPVGAILKKPMHRVRWQKQGSGMRLEIDGQVQGYRTASKNMARLMEGAFGTSAARWILIESAYDGDSISVERTIQNGPDGRVIKLPTQNRAYVPVRDIAVDSDGRLLYLDPQQASLRVVRVSP